MQDFCLAGAIPASSTKGKTMKTAKIFLLSALLTLVFVVSMLGYIHFLIFAVEWLKPYLGLFWSLVVIMTFVISPLIAVNVFLEEKNKKRG